MASCRLIAFGSGDVVFDVSAKSLIIKEIKYNKYSISCDGRTTDVQLNDAETFEMIRLIASFVEQFLHLEELAIITNNEFDGYEALRYRDNVRIQPKVIALRRLEESVYSAKRNGFNPSYRIFEHAEELHLENLEMSKSIYDRKYIPECTKVLILNQYYLHGVSDGVIYQLYRDAITEYNDHEACTMAEADPAYDYDEEMKRLKDNSIRPTYDDECLKVLITYSHYWISRSEVSCNINSIEDINTYVKDIFEYYPNIEVVAIGVNVKFGEVATLGG